MDREEFVEHVGPQLVHLTIIDQGNADIRLREWAFGEDLPDGNLQSMGIYCDLRLPICYFH